MSGLPKGLPNNVRDAQVLRRETPSERTLWSHLRNRQLDGRKFRRQHAIRNYVVDFYCAESKLIVEIDGGIHRGEQSVRDSIRDEALQRMGYRILRIAADFVTTDIDETLETIRQSL
jgi:very-short-patch-repair endonuclease